MKKTTDNINNQGGAIIRTLNPNPLVESIGEWKNTEGSSVTASR